LMRLFDGYIKRRTRMERDCSGVSALLGLDGFVVSAQCSTRRAASGGPRWRPPRIGPGASPATCERSAMAAARSWWGICRSQIGRCAGVGQALVALRRAGVCDPDLVGGVRGDRATSRADRAGSGGDRSWCRSAEHSVAQAARASACCGTRRWPRCAITAGPASITSPASARPARSGSTRRRSSLGPRSTRPCW
jgi:hypothetical protein